MSAVFPQRRMRRLRRTPALRRLVAEHRIAVDDLVAPLFVREDIDEPAPVASMPGVFQHSLDSLVAESKRLSSLGIQGLILFGIPDPSRRDAQGTAARDPDGIVQRALGEVRAQLGDSMVLIADLCLDEYTDHAHCGVLRRSRPSGRPAPPPASRVGQDNVTGNDVDNDATLELYGEVALAQARAGADLVAPSGMMDGQVGAIRSALDRDGLSDIGILAYSAKYASALYGPFRDAVDVTIANGGDRRGYQMDPSNVREAVAEARLDVAEGADIVMVKPALAYLDVIAEVRESVDVPVWAYHVSGEYAMVMAAGERGWLDAPAVAAEHVGAIRRAGADVVITYFAATIAAMISGASAV